jgi:uncharacterized membrane protein YgcG
MRVRIWFFLLFYQFIVKTHVSSPFFVALLVLQGMLLLKTLQLVPMASFLLDEVALTETHPESETQKRKALQKGATSTTKTASALDRCETGTARSTGNAAGSANGAMNHDSDDSDDDSDDDDYFDEREDGDTVAAFGMQMHGQETATAGRPSVVGFSDSALFGNDAFTGEGSADDNGASSGGGGGGGGDGSGGGGGAVGSGRPSISGFGDDALFSGSTGGTHTNTRSPRGRTARSATPNQRTNTTTTASPSSPTSATSGAHARSPSSQRPQKENPFQAALREVMVVDVAR